MCGVIFFVNAGSFCDLGKVPVDGGMLERPLLVRDEDQGVAGGFKGVVVPPCREVRRGHNQPDVALSMALGILDGDHRAVGVELHATPGEPAEFSDAAPGFVEECNDRPVAGGLAGPQERSDLFLREHLVGEFGAAVHPRRFDLPDLGLR